MMTNPNSLTTAGRQALKHVRDLREALKELNLEMVSADRYDDLDQLNELLRSTKQIEDAVQGMTSEQQSSKPAPMRPRLRAVPDHVDTDTYPRYVRRGQHTLVKVALRRNKVDTYEQNMSRREFDRIGDVLIEFSKNKASFSPQNVTDQTRYPAYRTYLVLGLLTERELLTMPTRGQYKFEQELSAEDLDNLWASLPQERN